MIYHTNQVFQFYDYGESSVKTESILVSQQVNEKLPNLIDTRVQKNLLDDES